MIQANELRIGNWVLFDLEEVYQQITARRIGYIGQANSKNQTHPFKPIPLTEEILLKCGFKEDSYGFKLGPIRFDYHAKGKLFPRLFTQTTLDNELMLHELQNIYFALTGKELELKF